MAINTRALGLMIKAAVFETSSAEAACLKLVDFLAGANALRVDGPIDEALKRASEPEHLPEIDENDFKLFWMHYPRKVGRPEVELAYRMEVGRGSLPHEMLRALRRYRAYITEQNIEPKFVKHGTTFIRDWKTWA